MPQPVRTGSLSDPVSQISNGGAETGVPAWLPESATRILLVSGSSGDTWGCAAAVEVADMVARHRPRTLLVNTVAGSAGPDGILRPDDGPGLGEVVAGRNRVPEVAFTPPGRSFIVVPAGRSTPGFVQLCAMPAFRHLVRAAGRGGTLLLNISEADLAHLSREPAVGEELEFDGLVLLGGASGPRNPPSGLRLLARVEPESGHPQKPIPARGTTARGPGFTRPTRTPAMIATDRSRIVPRGPVARLASEVRRRGLGRGAGGVAAVWLVAVVAVWLVWQGLSGWPAFEDELEPPNGRSTAEHEVTADRSPDPTVPPAAAEDAGAGEDRGSVADESDPAPGSSGVQPGVDLQYSILVASVVTYDDAAAKRGELAEQGNLAFIAPTPVRGGLYYRVFAGALEDREQARDLMRRLVEQGTKERERDWDMRPVRLALLLAEFPTEEEAEDERERLHNERVPAYVLAVGDTTGAIYRLYSGAFESEEAAGPADSMLSVAGRSATLVTRRGEPR